MSLSYSQISSFLTKIILLVWIVSIPFKNSIYQISIVVLPLLFFADLYFTHSIMILKNIFRTYKDVTIAFGIIVVSMTLSNVFGIQAEKAWYLELMFIARYGLIFFVLIYFYYKDYFSLKLLVLMILGSLTLQGVDGLYQHFYGIDFISGHQVIDGAWLTGAVFYYNPFGMLMSIGACITISLLIYHDRFKLSILQMGLLTIFTFIFIYDLLYSLSRASWVSFAVFVLCISALNYKKFNLKIIITLLLVLALIILFVTNDGSILARFNQLLQGDSSDRYYIWENSIKAFLQSPLFGYGLNSFKQVVTVKYSATHNSILELLLFVGLVGFVAFSYMLYLLIREVYQHKDAIGFSFFTSLLVITQFDTSVTGSKIFLSILTVCAFYILARRIVSSFKMP